MMKAIFPCSYYLPETAASLYITDNIVHACADKGIEVDLYTPSPTRNVPDGSVWEREERQMDGKLRIHRFHLYGEGKNPMLRALRYFLGEFILLHYCMWKKYDVAFVDSTPPIQGLKMPLIKWLKRKPTIYNVQDIFPDSLVGTGLTHEGSLIWKIGRIVEKITYRYADKIIVISEDFKKNIMAKGVSEDKIVVVYNWVDQNKVVDVPREENKLFDVYGLDRSKFYITYNGNIGLTQNMDMLLDVAKELQKEYEDIHFVLVGNGAYMDEVRRKVAEHQLGNVHLLPFQPYEDISHVFSLGDASLVISKPGVGANSVPSKTWSIMSASRPVLANFDENELKTIIENNHCGIFTKAGDKDAFKESILTLYNHRELCKEYGHNGRKFVLDNLTREVGTQKYVDVIKEVCGIKAK
uniref:glycosyltransferase family 4 protein n=1 Tax=Prevotella sp. TaxID=59823 RepID=UPI004025AF69